MKIFYFTSTGNNLDIAKRFHCELYSIPEILKNGGGEFSDDAIGIIFPCYYFGTPRIVREFLSKVKLRSDYIFGIMSYGNMSSDGLRNFKKIANSEGIKFSYLNEIIMIDNYIPLFDMEKQITGADKKNIEENMEKIISDIQNKKIFLPKKIFIAAFFSWLAQKFYKRGLGEADRKFTVEDNCNGCGICSRLCPVENIKIDKKPVFKHNCEECLACTHHCPQNAIRVKGEKNKTRYINKNITLKELLKK